MNLIEPINIRSITVSVVDEELVISVASPYQSRLVEVPTSGDGVQVRRITDAIKTGTGSGLIASAGFYVGLTERNYKIQIDTPGDVGTATFKWSNNGGTNWQGTLVPIPDEDAIDLELGVQIRATAGAGQDFNTDDYWVFSAEYWTEVVPVPIVTKTFQVKYANGKITFHSTDAGKTVYVTYQGRGSVVKAEDITQLIDTLDQGELLMRNLTTGGIAANKAVYIKVDGTFGLASAAATSTLAIGFVKVSDQDEGEVILHGRLSGFTGLTTGALYYLDVNGGIVISPTQAYRQVVGRAMSTTTLVVNIMFEQVVNVATILELKGENTGAFAPAQFVGFSVGGGWQVAQAQWSVKKPAVGCVKTADMYAGEIVLFGIIGGFSGLSRGTRYYLSATGGGISSTPPMNQGDIVQIVGWGYSTTELLVTVEHDYIEVP